MACSECSISISYIVCKKIIHYIFYITFCKQFFFYFYKSNFTQADFNFYGGVLGGLTEPPARDSICAKETDMALGDQTGTLVNFYFKQKMLTLLYY